MKTTLLKSALATFAIVATVSFTSCSKDDDNENPMPAAKNIIQVAQSDNQFSILVAAIEKAGLASTLESSGPFTVFAPTNDAFNALFSQLGVSSLSDISAETLKPILLNHVLSGSVKSAAITTGYFATANSNGPNMEAVNVYVEKNSGVTIDGSKVTTADIMASNGIIHVIDKVILPSSVVSHAINNPNFSILVQAVVKAGLADILSGTGPFTVFAPTNDAFNNLFSQLGISGISDLSAEVLKPILLNHVLSGAVKSSAISTGYFATANTYGPNATVVKVYVQKSSGVTVDGSNVIAADVIGSNGVIHVIDKVILPASVVSHAINNPNFSTLVKAVVKAGLVEALSGTGPFTVFAPTNDAFNALFSELSITGLDDLTTEQLTPILLYHVVPGNVTASQVATGSVPTLKDGSNISIVADGSGVKLNNSSNVIATDVQGTNGVIHAIDTVLLP
jgi:transforming growth factor-beta-induced protein